MSSILYRLPKPEEAVFISRPNRFLMNALTGSGEQVKVHVPDPGRLKELLFSGNRVLILPVPEDSSSARKTNWTLAGAMGEKEWVLVNTALHSRIAEKLFRSKFSPFQVSKLRREVKAPSGRSRFDFLLDRRWVEVKGCTLRAGKRALFPDAPTSRGRKHLEELTEMAADNIQTAVVFLVFAGDVKSFSPNRATDPKFASALEKAIEAGVVVKAVNLSFNGREVKWKGRLPVILNP